MSSSTKITVAVYHQNPKGQDGNDEAELDITICVAEPDPDTATLTISKVIVGGTAAFDDFSYILNSGSSTGFDVSGTSTVVLELGSYTVVEDGVSGGKITVGSETYSVSYEGCSGSLPLAGATCIVTNTLDVPGVDYGTLQVVKLIVGTTSATFSDFGFDVSGTATTSADFNANGINDLSLPVGTYTVTEGEAVGFVTTYDNCNNVSVTVGATSTCTITNTASDERFTLTIALSGDGHGHVTSADGFISCSSQPVEGMEVTGDCSETYPVGTVVNLTATPHEGSNFDNSWAAGFGTCTGNTTPCQVTITQNVDLSAHFALNQSSSGGGGGGGSRRSRSSSSDEPVPQVLGEQTSVVPTGAPDAGAGGTSAQSFYMALPSRPRFLAK